MSLDERIDALKVKHQALETAIEEEFNRPRPDDIQIASLKKQKLKIKDEIARSQPLIDRVQAGVPGLAVSEAEVRLLLHKSSDYGNAQACCRARGFNLEPGTPELCVFWEWKAPPSSGAFS